MRTVVSSMRFLRSELSSVVLTRIESLAALQAINLSDPALFTHWLAPGHDLTTGHTMVAFGLVPALLVKYRLCYPFTSQG